jgi:uncharacterized membrane protein
MKYLLSALIVGVLVATLSGCEKADQKALQAIEKARALKENLEKKAREIEETAKGVLPEGARKLLDKRKEEGKDRGNQEKGD